MQELAKKVDNYQSRCLRIMCLLVFSFMLTLWFMRHILEFTRQSSSLEVHRTSNSWSRDLKMRVFLWCEPWIIVHINNSRVKTCAKISAYALCKLIRAVGRRYSVNQCWLSRICSIVQQRTLLLKTLKLYLWFYNFFDLWSDLMAIDFSRQSMVQEFIYSFVKLYMFYYLIKIFFCTKLRKCTCMYGWAKQIPVHPSLILLILTNK